MKKRITAMTVAILCLSAFSLQAGIRIGAKAGVNLANASFSSSTFQTDNFTGFQIGPILEFSTLSGFGFDAAALYSQQGVKFNGISISDNYEGKTSTLDVPVNLKFKFSLVNILGCYLTAGPYVSFKLDNQGTLSSYQKTVKTEWVNKNFGVGLNLGAGFELIKHLQVGVNYQLALNNDYSSNVNIVDYMGNIIQPVINGKTRIWSITAAFFF